jgi:hypothetical protein
LPTFFAAAKKVGAAPYRGEANKPLTIQGKANAVGKPPNTNLTRPLTKQGKANTGRTPPNAVGKPKKTQLPKKPNRQHKNKSNEFYSTTL